MSVSDTFFAKKHLSLHRFRLRNGCFRPSPRRLFSRTDTAGTGRQEEESRAATAAGKAANLAGTRSAIEPVLRRGGEMKEGASAIRTLPPYDRNPRDTGCAASPRGSLQTFTLLQFAEIAVGADFQLAYGRLVGDDDACGMNLQRRDRPLVRVAPRHRVSTRGPSCGRRPG